jgi:hypothetical protein
MSIVAPGLPGGLSESVAFEALDDDAAAGGGGAPAPGAKGPQPLSKRTVADSRRAQGTPAVPLRSKIARNLKPPENPGKEVRLQDIRKKPEVQK